MLREGGRGPPDNDPYFIARVKARMLPDYNGNPHFMPGYMHVYSRDLQADMDNHPARPGDKRDMPVKAEKILLPWHHATLAFIPRPMP